MCILCLSKALSLKFLFGWSMEPLLQRDEWKYTIKTGKTVHYHVPDFLNFSTDSFYSVWCHAVGVFVCL